MIDWATMFEVARPNPPASADDIAELVAGLGQPLSESELEAVPEHLRAEATTWRMPARPLPESYLSFLRLSLIHI